ncbi:MAG: HTH-type transcriptional regulator DmlR [Candidatus Celerinatantimonas neptuna]|nr:MAG: HTH-type transcriptional regulator DmlR [Candidatus Celerinatantimonas neptuna]
MLDKLISMEAFVKTVDNGSFSAAAERMNMSQQMVARHVASLETKLGMRLLNRTTRRHGLTAEGQIYYQRCKFILAEIDDAEGIAQTSQKEPRGKLRVSAPITLGRYRIMPIITEFLRRYPAVEVELELNDRLVDLVEEGFEIAVRIGKLNDSQLIARELTPHRFVLCATPGYLQKHGTPSSPEELRQHECLGYGFNTRPGHKTWQLTHKGKTQTIRVHSRLHLTDAAALLQATLDDVGILLAPHYVVQEKIHSGELVFVLSGYQGPSRPIHLLYHPARQQSAKLKQFIELCLNRLRT